jgi:hypothetical protein
MRRWFLAYSALLLCLTGNYQAAAEERYGEWVLEQASPPTFTLSFKQSLPRGDRVVTSEIGFVCEGGVILIPYDGTFQNHQAEIPVVIQKADDQYDPSDLLQHWQTGIEYIFLQSKEEVDELASYLKTREAEGITSVHFFFPNDMDAGSQITNHIAIKVSGFSEGFRALQKSCAPEH